MAASLYLLSAGGTGGHLFPAEALAHELKRRGHIVHLATDERMERFTRDFPAEAVHVIPAATIGSKNPLAAARSMMKLMQGALRARSLIRRLRPAAVIGFGGYPTLPPLLMAAQMRVPTMVHEQNAVMGRANRLLSRRVDAIAGGFLPEGTGAISAKTVATGNPVRPTVLEAAKQVYAPPEGSGPFRLVVFGGSQGARYFSKVVPDALRRLPDELASRFIVTQQARQEDVAAVEGFYRERHIPAEVSPFFSDMARRIGEAHLVISRSGASTVSEISVIGRPAILVPYPYALDHDQAANAAALEAQGGAMVIPERELSAERLAGLFEDFVRHPARLPDMAAKAKAAGKPLATALLADLAEAIAGGTSVREFKGARA